MDNYAAYKKPSKASIAVVIASEWATSLALQLTWTTSIVGWDSATSSAVIAPPASATTTDSLAIAVGSVGDSTRTVMEYTGLGAVMTWSFSA
jgi:hypothetical protein